VPDSTFPKTTIELNDERTEAHITLGGESFTATAVQLQNLIGQLGLVRGEMLPEVPHRSPEDGQFLQVGGPIVEIVESNDGSIVRISLRTAQYGWIGFQFQPSQVVEVGRHLVASWGDRASS
jgi:hypothetical protein